MEKCLNIFECQVVFPFHVVWVLRKMYGNIRIAPFNPFVCRGDGSEWILNNWSCYSVMYTPCDCIMQKSLNCYSFLVLTIVLIVGQAPSVPANSEMFSIGAIVTGRTVTQSRELQVCKYIFLLYNSTRYSTNNTQKKCKHHKMFDQTVILYC